MFEIELSAVVLLVFVLVAACVDVLRRRIPNLLTGSMLITAMSLQLLTSGTGGLLTALGGTLVGFAFFMVPYLMRGMAAGDVKLMAAVGAFLGPEQALSAALTSLIAGTALGVLVMTYEYYRARVGVETSLAMKFPYAPAIAIGTAVSIFIGMGQ